MYKQEKWSDLHMAGTVFAILFAVLFVLTHTQAPTGSPFFATLGLLLVFIGFMAKASVWKSIFRMQTRVMACAQGLYMKDILLRSAFIYLFVFLLYSLYMTFGATHALSFYIWLIGFGVGFDALRFYYNRSFNYTYAPFLIQRLAQDLESAVKNNDEAKAFEYLEVVIDACAKATHKRQIRFATTSLNAVQTLIESYVQEASLRGVRLQPDEQKSGLTFLDKVNSLCIFVSERLIWVFDEAIKENADPIAENIISELGKMSVFFARHSPLVAGIPLSFLSKCADIAQEKKHDGLLIRIALTLSETTKLLLAYTKERNESFRDLIITAIATLEQIVKLIFKQSQEINVALLMQPFAEIGEFIGRDDMRSFPDRDEVIKEIRRILTEFQALQVVTKNIETMAPALGEDSTSTYQQDLPYTKS